MATMLDRSVRRLAPICLLATLACRPEPAAIEEPAPPADPGGPTATVKPSEASKPEPETEAPELAVNEPAAGTTADRVPETEPEPKPEPEAKAEAKPKPKAEAKPKPLPKPIHKPSAGKCRQRFAVGEKVKNFRLSNVAGDKTISPAGYRNRVVLLNFWGTWCKPCLAELPEFDRLYRKYRRHGMTLVAVATDEDAKAVQAFIDQHKLIAKVALDGQDAAAAYGRPNFPFSFVIDGDGTIVAAYNYVDDRCLGDLEQVIRNSLEQL